MSNMDINNDVDTFSNIEYIMTYDLEDQVNDLAEATGMGKHVIRRLLKFQRRFIQEKLRLGYGVNLKGIVKIMPKEREDGIILTSQVAQSVVRPACIKKIPANMSPDDILKENMIEDEELS